MSIILVNIYMVFMSMYVLSSVGSVVIYNLFNFLCCWFLYSINRDEWNNNIICCIVSLEVRIWFLNIGRILKNWLSFYVSI